MCRGTGQLIAFGPLVGRVVSAENATGSAKHKQEKSTYKVNETH